MQKRSLLLVLLLFIPLVLSMNSMSFASATVDTFTGETIDGHAWYYKDTYPPDTTGSSSVVKDGESGFTGQSLITGTYRAVRLFVSFDTSSLPDDAEIDSVELRVKTKTDYSSTDFVLGVYGGTQPIWGDSLTIADWGSSYSLCDTWDSTNYIDEVYINFTIPVGEINKGGRTQFELISNREYNDVTPTEREDIEFYTADSVGNEPKLVITYTITSPTGSMKQTIGENWYYAGEWHDFEAVYTYGGTFDVVQFAFSDLYDSYSLSFDGNNDIVTVSDDTSLDFATDDYSVSAWVYWDSTQSDTKAQIIDKWQNYQLNINNGYINWMYDHSVEGWQILASTSTIPDSTWIHITGTYRESETRLSLYIDGILNNTETMEGTSFIDAGEVTIGAWNTTWERFKGCIDQVQIFDDELTATEIVYNMNHMKPFDETNLVLSFHFDEGSGSTYTDGMILNDDHWVITQYDVTNDIWSLESGEEIASLQTGTTEQIDNDFIVTYEIFFKDTILDRIDVDVYIYSINITGNVDPWDRIATNYFNIYNLGGFTTFESNNVAGRIEGGDVFDLYADGSDAWVRVEQIYRKIQHVKIQAGFVIKDPNDVNDVFVRYGIDFVDPSTGLFIKGWNVLINVTAIDVTDASHCTLEVRWYYNDVQIGTTDTMYSMWEDRAFMTPDGEYSGTRFHLDLWFNKVNGSSVIGGRVAPFMYGLTKDDPAWWLWWNWWGAGEWKPLRTNTTDSFLFTNLHDYTGRNITSKALDLTRLWCNLTNVGANDDIFVMNYRTFDYTFASGGMEGINTPPFPETLDPELPAGGGILAGLFSALKGLATSIGNALTTGVLALWSTFVSFIDTLFSMAGWNNGFSVILSWIASFLGWMVDGITYAVSLLYSTFLLMANWLTFAIGRFTGIASGFVDIYNILVWIWTQGNAGWLSFTSWVTPLLPLLPLAIFIWIFSVNDTEGLIKRIMLLWDLLRNTIGFLIQIGEFVINIIYGLIEKTPVIE